MSLLLGVVLGMPAMFSQAPSGVSLLAKHVSALQNAKSLEVVFNVRVLPSAGVEYRLYFTRPDKLRIEKPDGFIVADGKTIWTYFKESNTYTKRSGTLQDALQSIGGQELVAWSAFFLKDQFKDIKTAQVGSPMTVQGYVVDPVTFTLDARKNLTATLYVDRKLGVARGVLLKATKNNDSVETLIVASELRLGNDALSEDLFAFQAPAGAKEVQYTENELAKWYTNLDEAMKVAQATNRMLFVDFSAVW